MKEYAHNLLANVSDPVARKNTLREYMQARILETLQRSGAMVSLAFQGGTALRFLYSIPRYSEDLDFALERPLEYDGIRAYLQAIQNQFEKEGYVSQVKVSDRKVIQSAFVDFPGLPYEMGFSDQRGEKLSVKIEVDTNPPEGAVLETTLIRRYVTLHLQHHDRASLLSGKLHAILQRPHTKGRDIYDLLWYLSDPDWPEPNFLLLNHALAQTGWAGPELQTQNWRDQICRSLSTVNWQQAVRDVRPFLERSVEVDLLTRENIVSLLKCPPG